jgi:predicted Zn-ribbon and HTH transcriptional regulator
MLYFEGRFWRELGRFKYFNALHLCMETKVIEQITCLRCGYAWFPTTPTKPKTCANPKCRSVYYDTPRKRQAKKLEN